MKAFIPALLALTLAGAAHASPCGEKIASLQSRFDAAPPVAEAPVSAATTETRGASETVDAKLHHQPAPASAADADKSADSPESRRAARFKVLIEEARAADHSGDAAICESSVAKAQAALAP